MWESLQYEKVGRPYHIAVVSNAPRRWSNITINNSISYDINNPIEIGKLFGMLAGATATQQTQPW